jgi:hypothetical protein
MELIDIDGVNIPFSKEWKKIAISVSGGADSALLAYIICELFTNIEIHIISHTRMWKSRPWQQYDSIKIYNYLESKFTNHTFKRHTNHVAPDIEWGSVGPSFKDEYGKIVSGDNAQIRSYNEYICYHEKVDAFFNAVTRNPKNVNFEGLHTRSIDPNENNSHLVLMEHMGFIVSHPFRFIEKDWVIKQYKDKNLLELLNITRSCEGEFINLDYKSYIPYQDVPICNECFWCKERNWAFKQNGLDSK